MFIYSYASSTSENLAALSQFVHFMIMFIIFIMPEFEICLELLREYKRLYDELEKDLIRPERCFADIRDMFRVEKIDARKAAELLDKCYEMKRIKRRFMMCLARRAR